MKTLYISVLLILLAFPGFSQGWVNIEGNIWDSRDSLPVINYPVTILADSSNGVSYFNVVWTDSLGHYYDNIPVLTGDSGMVYVQVEDCDNMMLQQVVFYDPVQTNYIVDFWICTDIVFPCSAYFVMYPDTAGSPLYYQFFDQSTGNPESWYWYFGDGSYSQEQNPVHQYQGPGTYEVCLSIAGNDCQDSFCQTITISDTVFYQMYGQVYQGNFPMTSGTVMLYMLNPSGGFSPLDAGCRVDTNGIYYFTLVPDGIYLLQAIPDETEDYVPTYYGGTTSWQAASALTPINFNGIVNIHLAPTIPLNPGPASVSGKISYVYGRNGNADPLTVILMDENLMPLDFAKVDGDGNYEFASIGYGVYYLRAELAGAVADNIRFELSAGAENLILNMDYNGFSILGLEENFHAGNSLKIFPNPVKNSLTVSLAELSGSDGDISIYSSAGQPVIQNGFTGSASGGSIIMDVEKLPEGIYILRLQLQTGKAYTAKFLKAG